MACSRALQGAPQACHSLFLRRHAALQQRRAPALCQASSRDKRCRGSSEGEQQAGGGRADQRHAQAAAAATAAPSSTTPGQPPPQCLPRHVAIIMDGNSRWAAARGLPAAAGHRAGVEALRRAVAECLALGIEALTVFAFSAENWHRPAMEIELLLRLVESTLAAELEGLHQQGVRLAFVGERHALPRSLAAAAAAAETATAGGAALALAVCLGYGGQQDLAAAARAVAARVAAGELALDDVTADVLAAHLGTARLGDLQSPDLLIRPGGEMRASNFLLFEGAYAEWVFTPTLWPDFTEEHLREALREYSRRQRRFGRR